ncbi:hypothetical protein B0T10DRAFT_470936 [Thelonectria olida]|uniref:Uncharacterized protein n=1 Tax=Thelonectria olida TaxID=1576542 RepID=A0A9P8WJ03_9HYPO|nr:hypothetical protein B0T10DRAFT_470936 [Thelonectria olida]
MSLIKVRIRILLTPLLGTPQSTVCSHHGRGSLTASKCGSDQYLLTVVESSRSMPSSIRRRCRSAHYISPCLERPRRFNVRARRLARPRMHLTLHFTRCHDSAEWNRPWTWMRTASDAIQ